MDDDRVRKIEDLGAALPQAQAEIDVLSRVKERLVEAVQLLKHAPAAEHRCARDRYDFLADVQVVALDHPTQQPLPEQRKAMKIERSEHEHCWRRRSSGSNPLRIVVRIDESRPDEVELIVEIEKRSHLVESVVANDGVWVEKEHLSTDRSSKTHVVRSGEPEIRSTRDELDVREVSFHCSRRSVFGGVVDDNHLKREIVTARHHGVDAAVEKFSDVPAHDYDRHIHGS